MILHHRVVGSGPAIVLIHGLFGSRDNLQTLAGLLSQYYRVVTLDLRNHGDSPRADNMNLFAMAEDIYQTMTSLDESRFAILGHSLGGKVAMMTALQYPNSVAALIVADIAPVTYGVHRHNDVFAALKALPLTSMKTRSEALSFMRETLHEPELADFLLKGLRKADEGGFQLKYNVPVLIEDYQSIAGWPDVDASYDGPVRFIRGSESDYINADHASAIQRYFPAASLRTIEGAGHWLHAQKPVAFNRLVERFLQETYPH